MWWRMLLADYLWVVVLILKMIKKSWFNMFIDCLDCVFSWLTPPHTVLWFKMVLNRLCGSLKAKQGLDPILIEVKKAVLKIFVEAFFLGGIWCTSISRLVACYRCWI